MWLGPSVEDGTLGQGAMRRAKNDHSVNFPFGAAEGPVPQGKFGKNSAKNDNLFIKMPSERHILNEFLGLGSIQGFVMRCGRTQMHGFIKRYVPRFIVPRFVRQEEGSATVEFVIWLPVLLIVMAIIADASLVFGSRSTIMRVLQDTNRAVSIGKIMELDEAEQYLTDTLASIAPNAVVETTVDQGVITSIVNVPLSDLTALGLISKFYNLNLTIASQHLSEG